MFFYFYPLGYLIKGNFQTYRTTWGLASIINFQDHVVSRRRRMRLLICWFCVFPLIDFTDIPFDLQCSYSSLCMAQVLRFYLYFQMGLILFHLLKMIYTLILYLQFPVLRRRPLGHLLFRLLHLTHFMKCEIIACVVEFWGNFALRYRILRFIFETSRFVQFDHEGDVFGVLSLVKFIYIIIIIIWTWLHHTYGKKFIETFLFVIKMWFAVFVSHYAWKSIILAALLADRGCGLAALEGLEAERGPIFSIFPLFWCGLFPFYQIQNGRIRYRILTYYRFRPFLRNLWFFVFRAQNAILRLKSSSRRPLKYNIDLIFWTFPYRIPLRGLPTILRFDADSDPPVRLKAICIIT